MTKRAGVAEVRVAHNTARHAGIKICKNCEHYGVMDEAEMCLRNATVGVDLVDGSSIILGDLDCRVERMTERRLKDGEPTCGEEGRYWYSWMDSSDE